jgi:hypothetical protein
VRAKALILVCGALGLVAATLPAAAAAKPVHFPGSFSISAKLPSSNGYQLSLSSEGHGKVMISAERGESSYTLTAPGRASRNGIKATLGPFGQVDVEFKQIGHAEKRPPPPGCSGRGGTSLNGVLRGTIHFRGRLGFASADVSRVSAKLIQDHAQTCKHVPALRLAGRQTARAASRLDLAAKDPESELVALTAFKHAEGRVVGLSAARIESEEEALSLIFAFTGRDYGRVMTRDLVLVSDGLSASDPGVKPETAKIFGVSPLQGEATYSSDRAAAEQWQGSLRVALPGEGVVPLAGKGFRATLCRGGESDAAFKHCIDRGFNQTSGSQSQSLLDTRLSWSR